MKPRLQINVKMTTCIQVQLQIITTQAKTGKIYYITKPQNLE